MIALMFKYNEKYYKKCCRCCILICFIKCDKSKNRPKHREIMTYIDSWNEEIDISKLFKMTDFDSSKGPESPKSTDDDQKYDEDMPPHIGTRDLRITSIADMISDVDVDENMDINEVKLSPLSKPMRGSRTATVTRMNLQNGVSEDIYMIGTDYKSPELTTNHTETMTRCELNQTPSYVHQRDPRQITIFESDKLDLNQISSTQTQHISAETDGDMNVVLGLTAGGWSSAQTDGDDGLVMVNMVPLDRKMISATPTHEGMGISTPTITTPTMTGMTSATPTSGDYSMDVNAPRSRSATYKRHLSPENTPVIKAQNPKLKGKIKIFRLRKL